MIVSHLQKSSKRSQYYRKEACFSKRSFATSVTKRLDFCRRTPNERSYEDLYTAGKRLPTSIRIECTVFSFIEHDNSRAYNFVHKKTLLRREHFCVKKKKKKRYWYR